MDSSVIRDLTSIVISVVTLLATLISSFVILGPRITKRKAESEKNYLREQLRYDKRLCVFKGCQEYASASYEYEASTDNDINRQPIFTAVEWEGHSKFTMYFCVDHLAYTVRSVIELVAVPLRKQWVFLYNDLMKNQGRLRGRTATEDGFTDGPGPVTIYNSNLRIECVECGRRSLGNILMFDDGRKHKLDYDGDAEFLAKLLKYCPDDGDVFVLYGDNDTLEGPVELARGDPNKGNYIDNYTKEREGSNMSMFKGRINRKQYLAGMGLTTIVNTGAFFGLIWSNPEYFMLVDFAPYPLLLTFGIIIGSSLVSTLLAGISGNIAYVMFILVQGINIFSSYTLALSAVGILLGFVLALSHFLRRMQDLGHSPSWITAVTFLACAPVVGWIVWWALLVLKGSAEVNRYGLPNTAGVCGKPQNGKE